MEWPVYLMLLSCIVWLGEGKAKKALNTCKHGGYLKNVNFEGGEQSNNYTLIGNVSSMKDCVEKCCHTKDCDLAMLKTNKKCYSLNCNRDESCHIIHMKSNSQDGTQIAFITKSSIDATDKKAKHKHKKLRKKKKKSMKITKLQNHAKISSKFSKHKNNVKISPNVAYTNNTNDNVYESLRQNQSAHDVEDDDEDQDDGRQYVYVDQQKYSKTNKDNITDPNNFNVSSVKKIKNKILSDDNNTITLSSKVLKTNKIKKTAKDKDGVDLEGTSNNYESKTETHSKDGDPEDGSYHYSSSYNYDSRDGDNLQAGKQQKPQVFKDGFGGFPGGGFKYPGGGFKFPGGGYKFPGAHLPIPQGPEYDYEGDISSYNPYHYANRENGEVTPNDFNNLPEKTDANTDVETNSTRNNSKVSPNDAKARFKPTVKKPTKDQFVTEIAEELHSNPDNENNEDEDEASGSEVEIDADGTLVATPENTTVLNVNQTDSLLNSTKYQPFKNTNPTLRYDEMAVNQTVSDFGHYDNQVTASKYMKNSSITNQTLPWQQPEFRYNSTQQYTSSEQKGSFGDVGDAEIAPQQKTNVGDAEIAPQQKTNEGIQYYNNVTDVAQEKYNGTAYMQQNKSTQNENMQYAQDKMVDLNSLYQPYQTNVTTGFYNLSNAQPTQDMFVGQIQNELLNIYSEKDATTENVPRNKPLSNYNTQPVSSYNTQPVSSYNTQPVGNNNQTISFQNTNMTTDYNSQYTNPSDSENNEDEKNQTIGGSLFPTLKKNGTDVEQIQDELASGSAEDEEEEEKKEEKITKSIQSSYDAFVNASKKKTSMPKDTEVLLIAEELESGSGSGSGSADYTDDEEAESNIKSKGFEKQSKTKLKKLKYDDESEDNVSLSIYNPPLYEWQSSHGSKVIKKPQNSGSPPDLQKTSSFGPKNSSYKVSSSSSTSSFQTKSKSASYHKSENIKQKESVEEENSGDDDEDEEDDDNDDDNDDEDDELQNETKEPKFEDMMKASHPNIPNTANKTSYNNNSSYAAPNPYYQYLNQQSSYQGRVQKTSWSNFKENTSQPSPTSRTKQIMKPVRNWPATFTERPNYSQYKDDEVDDEVEEGESGKRSEGFTNKKTTRSTIWKKNVTKEINNTIGSSPTAKHAKLLSVKAVQVDKKPPKKSFLPFTDQLEPPMNAFEGAGEDEGWLQQNLLVKNALRPQNSDSFEQPNVFDSQPYATYAEHIKHHRRKHIHHKTRHHVASNGQFSDDESGMLIPIGKLPPLLKKHHRGSVMSRAKVHHRKLKHKSHHAMMINTGIKANSLLGQILTGDATPDASDNSNSDLTAFATQMALSNTPTHQTHKKNKNPLKDAGFTELDNNPLGYNGLPLENNLAFPYNDEHQTNGFYPGSSNFVYNAEQPQTNSMHHINNALPQQSQSDNQEQHVQTNNLIDQHPEPAQDHHPEPAQEDRSDSLQTLENGNSVAENEQNNAQSPAGDDAGSFSAVETNGQQNIATLNVLNNINGRDRSEGDLLAQRFNTDLTGLGDEISKIPGIAQITGVQTGQVPGSSPEVFAQRRVVSDSNGLRHNQHKPYMGRFNTFNNFNNFVAERNPWLNFQRNQRPLMSMGKKKNKLLKPANLTETYLKDEKQKENLLTATKFFIQQEARDGRYSWNNGAESALKINITDNPDESILPLTEDALIEKNVSTVDGSVNEQNDTVSTLSQQNKALNETKPSNQTVTVQPAYEQASSQLSTVNTGETLHQRTPKSDESNNTKAEGDHIPWETTNGKNIQPANQDDGRNGSNLNTPLKINDTNNEKQTFSKQNSQTDKDDKDKSKAGDHIPWRAKAGKGVKPSKEEDSGNGTSSSRSSEVGEKVQTQSEKVNKEGSTVQETRLNDLENKLRLLPDGEANWKEVVMETQYSNNKEKQKSNLNNEHVAKATDKEETKDNNYNSFISNPRHYTSRVSSDRTKVSPDHTMKRLSQELRRTSRTKPMLPSHRFFHALKEVLVNRLHSLNSGGDVMLNRDEPGSLLASITTKLSSAASSTSSKKNKKKKKEKRRKNKKRKGHKYELKQSKIVKDGPNKGASLLDIEAKRQEKKKEKERKINKGKYKEKKKIKNKKVQKTLDYNVKGGFQQKATHKKENDKQKHVPAIKYSRHHHHHQQQNQYIPSDDSQYDISPEEQTTQAVVAQRDDYNHGHPMMGHRFGDANYQSTHKYANHDYSKKLGHFGMHNDTADNHLNNDQWADRDPNNTDNVAGQQAQQITQGLQQVNQLLQTQAPLLPQPQVAQYPEEQAQQQREELAQQQSPDQKYTHGLEKEREITDKLNTFNLLANSLTNKLNDLNSVNGMKAITGADWKNFINYQKRLDGMKQARQQVINHFLHKDPICNRGLTVRGATLRGGVLSGEFKSMGVVDTQKQCVDECCKSQRGCDVAMTIGRECINIKCFNKKQCTIAPAGNLKIYNRVLPVVTFIRKPKHTEKRSTISHPFSVNDAVEAMDENEQEELKTIIHNVQYHDIYVS